MFIFDIMSISLLCRLGFCPTSTELNKVVQLSNLLSNVVMKRPVVSYKNSIDEMLVEKLNHNLWLSMLIIMYNVLLILFCKNINIKGT